MASSSDDEEYYSQDLPTTTKMTSGSVNLTIGNSGNRTSRAKSDKWDETRPQEVPPLPPSADNTGISGPSGTGSTTVGTITRSRDNFLDSKSQWAPLVRCNVANQIPIKVRLGLLRSD